MFDDGALGMEIGEGAGADILGFIGDALRLSDAIRAARQPIRAAQELLALFELRVRGRRVVRVSVSEQGLAVVR